MQRLFRLWCLPNVQQHFTGIEMAWMFTALWQQVGYSIVRSIKRCLKDNRKSSIAIWWTVNSVDWGRDDCQLKITLIHVHWGYWRAPYSFSAHLPISRRVLSLPDAMMLKMTTPRLHYLTRAREWNISTRRSIILEEMKGPVLVWIKKVSLL